MCPLTEESQNLRQRLRHRSADSRSQRNCPRSRKSLRGLHLVEPKAQESTERTHSRPNLKGSLGFQMPGLVRLKTDPLKAGCWKRWHSNPELNSRWSPSLLTYRIPGW